MLFKDTRTGKMEQKQVCFHAYVCVPAHACIHTQLATDLKFFSGSPSFTNARVRTLGVLLKPGFFFSQMEENIEE